MSEPIKYEEIDHAGSDTFNDRDLAILNEVSRSLANGLQLKAWWEETNSTNSYADRFATVLPLNRPDESFAFFDQAPLNGKMLPVLGDLQDLFYDRPKSPDPVTQASAEWMQAQVREVDKQRVQIAVRIAEIEATAERENAGAMDVGHS